MELEAQIVSMGWYLDGLSAMTVFGRGMGEGWWNKSQITSSVSAYGGCVEGCCSG